MSLNLFEKRESGIAKRIRAFVGGQVGVRPAELERISSHRPDYFGRHFQQAFETALNDCRAWERAEIELMAHFVQHSLKGRSAIRSVNKIQIKGLPDDVVTAVMQNWRKAPIDAKLQATLGFLQKLTREPGQLSANDHRSLIKAGVSRQAVNEAIEICFLFSTYCRLSNAFGLDT